MSSSDSREGDGTPLQYSCLANPMDGGAWWAAVHGVEKSRTWLSYFAFTFHCHALEKEMATHSSILAWRIPGTGEPGGLPSMGSHRVGHDWSDLAAAAAAAVIKELFLKHLFQQCSVWVILGQTCVFSVPSKKSLEEKGPERTVLIMWQNFHTHFIIWYILVCFLSHCFSLLFTTGKTIRMNIITYI